MSIPEQLVVKIRANQKALLLLSSFYHDGKTAPVGTKPVWTTSDGSLVVLKPSDNGYECEVQGRMKVGACKVLVEAEGSSGKIAYSTNFEIDSPYADCLKTSIGGVSNP